MSHTERLRRSPGAFRQLTGITPAAFDGLLAELAPRYEAADARRKDRPGRKRKPGAGHKNQTTSARRRRAGRRPARPGSTQLIAYFAKHTDRLGYFGRLRTGRSIGSGAVEGPGAADGPADEGAGAGLVRRERRRDGG